MSRCKFCGNPLKEEYESYYFDGYYCTCEGMKQYVKLTNELKILENKITEKRIEIKKFCENTGVYAKIQKSIRAEEQKTKDFEECCNYREYE